jgi:hypothetical protein
MWARSPTSISAARVPAADRIVFNSAMIDLQIDTFPDRFSCRPRISARYNNIGLDALSFKYFFPLNEQINQNIARILTYFFEI